MLDMAFAKYVHHDHSPHLVRILTVMQGTQLCRSDHQDNVVADEIALVCALDICRAAARVRPSDDDIGLPSVVQHIAHEVKVCSQFYFCSRFQMNFLQSVLHA